MTRPSASQSGSETPAQAPAPRYRRVLLKVSGEAFCQPGGFGIDGPQLESMAREIVAAGRVGAQLAVVVGGGNIIRGARLAQEGHLGQAAADSMGMLGTVINGLALREMLEKLGQPARLLSAISLESVSETFERSRAVRYLEQGHVVIFVAGTGNPFFTTDTCAALRAAEIGASVLLKATKVDGIYDKDPHRHADARRYTELTFQEAVDQRLKVMDLTAFSLCMEQNVPVIVFDMNRPGHIADVVSGKPHGTRVLNR